MAAMSDRLAATALAPSSQGGVVFKSKWTLSMSRSLVSRVSKPGLGLKTAASSPMPSLSPAKEGRARSLKNSTKSRSPALFFKALLQQVDAGLGLVPHRGRVLV